MHARRAPPAAGSRPRSRSPTCAGRRGRSGGPGRRRAGRAGREKRLVEQPVQPLLGQVADLRERDRERVEPEAERLRVEVAARVQALRLVPVGRRGSSGLSVTARSSRATCASTWSSRSSAAPWTCGSTRNETGGCGRSDQSAAPACSATSAAWIRAWPGSPLSAPMRGEYGRSDAPVSAAVERAGERRVLEQRARARRRAQAVSAGASGAPLTSAMPLLDARLVRRGAAPGERLGRRDRARRPRAPRPRRSACWNRWLSATTSPALVDPARRDDRRQAVVEPGGEELAQRAATRRPRRRGSR